MSLAEMAKNPETQLASDCMFLFRTPVPLLSVERLHAALQSRTF